MKNYQVTYSVYKNNAIKSVRVKALDRLRASRTARVKVAMDRDIDMQAVRIVRIEQVAN